MFSAVKNWGLESPQNPQTRMSALRRRTGTDSGVYVSPLRGLLARMANASSQFEGLLDRYFEAELAEN